MSISTSELREILLRVRYLIANAPEELRPAMEERGLIIARRVREILEGRGREEAAPAPEEARPTPTPQIQVPDIARQIWTLAGGNPDIFGLYMQTYPDPQIQAIGRNPAQLNALINQFGLQIGVPPAQAADGIQKAPLQSSNVYGYRYDPLRKRLTVRFNEGSVYRYEQVPKIIFDMFSAGNGVARTTGSNRWGRWWRGKKPSLGAAVHQLLIAGQFPYQRVR